MKMTKRFLALFLALLMAFGSFPSAVIAAGEEEAAPAATAEPAAEAVSEPVPEPTAAPVPEPTAEPTPEPTAVPTAEPTAVPTEEPVEQPEQAPVVPQAPAEPEQPGVEEPMNENEDEYSSAPQAGGQSAEQGPEAGLPGFELPGIVVPTGAPETEIIAPESQGEDMNAENGIATIANGDVIARFDFYLTHCNFSCGNYPEMSLPSDWGDNRPGGLVANGVTHWYYHSSQFKNSGVQFRVTPEAGYVITSAKYTNAQAHSVRFESDVNGSLVFRFSNTNSTPISMGVTYTMVAQKPTLGVTITTDAAGEVLVGDTVELTVTITPDGSTPFSKFTKTLNGDVTVTIGGTQYTVNNITQNTDGSWTGTLDYTVQESDNGSIAATADASVRYSGNVDITVNNGTDPSGTFTSSAVVEGTASTSFTVDTVGLSMTKTASTESPKLGDTVTYDITVKNTGTLPLNNVTVTDNEDWLTGKLNQTIDTLAAGASQTFTASVDVTADFIKAHAGQPLTNTATASGATAKGTRASATDSAEVNIPSIEELAPTLDELNGLFNVVVVDRVPTLFHDHGQRGPYKLTIGDYTLNKSGNDYMLRIKWDRFIEQYSTDVGYEHYASSQFSNYVLRLTDDGWQELDNNNKLSSKSNCTIAVLCDEDYIGGPNGTGDGIPDKYQKTVTFKVEGGTWSDGTETDKTVVVDMKDDDGRLTDYAGKGHLTADQIPTRMAPKKGYTGGAWDVEFTTETEITDNVTYTYRFEVEKITITYKATEGGSVNPESETLNPVTGTATGSQAVAKNGFVFVNWTDEGGNEVGTDSSYTPGKSGERYAAATYTANFAADANGDGIADSTQTLLITIYGGEAEATYDGQVHDSSEVKLQYSYAIQGDEKNWKYDNLPAGVTVELAGGYSSVVSGTNAGYYYANLLDKDEEDNFAAFVVNKGTFADAVIVGASEVSLHIKKAPLTVTLETTRTYTGEEIKETLQYIYGDDEQNEGLTLKADGLADCDRIYNVAADVSGTEVGPHKTSTYQELRIYDADEKFYDRRGNYNITFEAILHIVKPKADEYTASVTVTNVNEYDALSYGMQPVPKGTITEGPGREDYREPTYTYYEKVGSDWNQMAEGAVPKNVGDYYVEATWAGVEPNLPEVTAQSRVFHIRPLNLMFNGNVYREYTGDLISVPVTEDMYNLLNGLDKFGYPGEHLVLSDPVSGTVVGDYPHYFGNKDAPHFGAKVLDAKSNDVTENYTVGGVVTLHITPAVLTVKPKNASKTYGENDPALGYDVSGWKKESDKTALEDVVLSREPGERVGHYEITATGPETLGKNYTVNYDEKGDFEITKAPLTITANGTLTYTGNTYNVYVDVEGSGPVGSTYHIKGEPVEGALQFNDKLTGLNFQVGGVAGPAGIDKEYKNLPAGSYTITNSDNENVSGCYDVTLEVHISFTRQLAADALSSRYDGKEHANVEVRDLVTGAVLTEGTDYEVSYVNDHYGDDAAEGDVTNAGHVSFAVTGKGDYDGATVTYDKYVTNEVGEHQYEITRRPATLTAATESWPYDGQPHKATTIEQEGFVAGQGVDPDRFSFEQITDVGSIDNVLSKDDKLFYRAKEGTDLNNYAITEQEGTLTITAKAYDPADPENGITITPPEDVTYNGKAQEQEPTIKDGDKPLVKGADYDLSWENNTNAGEAKVTVKFKGNYSGEAETSFQIEQFAIYLYGKETKPYNGKDQTISFNADIHTDQRKAIKAHGNTLHASITGKDVGTYDIDSLAWSVVDSNGKYVSDNYKVEVQGHLSLTITPVELTVTAEDNGKRFGKEDPELTYTVTGWQENDGSKDLLTDADVTLTREDGEAVGEYVITPSVSKELKNYTIKTETGTFTIRPAYIIPDNAAVVPPEGVQPEDIINVTVGDLPDRVYNGQPQEYGPALTAEEEMLQQGEDYELSFANSTNVGTVTVTVTGIGNYTGQFTTTYAITPAPLTVSSESNTKVYDGTALTAPGSVEGLVNGETVEVDTVSITNAGTVTNTPTIVWGSTDSRNYTVTNGTIGALTVTARPVTVNTESATRVYDGTALTAPGSIVGLAPGETAAVNTVSITDAGTVTNTPTVAWGSTDSRNYTVTNGTIGTLTVTARTVTLTSGSATRAYNGAALTNGAVTVGGQGFVGGQGAAYTVTGSQTAVGTSANAFTYRLTGGAQARNYDITTATGTLTVTPAGAGAMTVSAPTNFLYDGAAHQWTPTVTGIGGAALTAGVDYNVTYSTANFTDAGAITVTITGIGNYAGTVTRTYRINQRLVIMSSGDATRAYNGQPLTNDDVTVTGNGFAAGDGATYNVTGRRTLPGTARNLFTYRLNAGTDADNYTIMQVYGDLTVEPAENTAEIEDNETPLGGQPDDADDADGGDDAEIAEIEDDDTPLAALPVIDDDDDGNGRDGGDDGNGGGYALNEQTEITEDAAPLAGGPAQQECCILHFILMLGALCVAVYYTYDSKKRQEREFELRAEMQ